MLNVGEDGYVLVYAINAHVICACDIRSQVGSQRGEFYDRFRAVIGIGYSSGAPAAYPLTGHRRNVPIYRPVLKLLP